MDLITKRINTNEYQHSLFIWDAIRAKIESSSSAGLPRGKNLGWELVRRVNDLFTVNPIKKEAKSWFWEVLIWINNFSIMKWPIMLDHIQGRVSLFCRRLGFSLEWPEPFSSTALRIDNLWRRIFRALSTYGAPWTPETVALGYHWPRTDRCLSILTPRLIHSDNTVHSSDAGISATGSSRLVWETRYCRFSPTEWLFILSWGRSCNIVQWLL